MPYVSHKSFIGSVLTFAKVGIIYYYTDLEMRKRGKELTPLAVTLPQAGPHRAAWRELSAHPGLFCRILTSLNQEALGLHLLSFC